MRMRDLQVSALVTPVCSMQPWLQVTWVCLRDTTDPDLLLT